MRGYHYFAVPNWVQKEVMRGDKNANGFVLEWSAFGNIPLDVPDVDKTGKTDISMEAWRVASKVFACLWLEFVAVGQIGRLRRSWLGIPH